MTEGGAHRRRFLAGRRSAAVLVVLLPFSAAGLPSLLRADTPPPESAPAPLTRVGAIRFVVPGTTEGETAADGAVFKADTLRDSLQSEIGRPCEPARLSETIAGRYRALGYIPSIRADCDEGPRGCSPRLLCDR